MAAGLPCPVRRDDLPLPAVAPSLAPDAAPGSGLQEHPRIDVIGSRPAAMRRTRIHRRRPTRPPGGWSTAGIRGQTAASLGRGKDSHGTSLTFSV